MFDPFSDDTPKTENKQEEKTVADKTENNDRLTVTLKGGAGFDSPWIVIHGSTVAEVTETLNDQALKALMDRTAEVGQYFAGLGGQKTQQPKPAAPARPQQPAQAASSGDGRQCQHGEMTYREGFNEQKGKAWRGYFCPTPKGTPDQCKAQFLRD